MNLAGRVFGKLPRPARGGRVLVGTAAAASIGVPTFLAESGHHRRPGFRSVFPVGTRRSRLIFARRKENAAMRNAFLEDNTWQSSHLTPTAQILGIEKYGTLTADMLDNALKAIPKAADAAPVAERMVYNMDQLFDQRIGDMDRQLKATTEGLQMSTTGRRNAVAGIYSAGNLDELLAASGLTGFDVGVRKMEILPQYVLSGEAKRERFQGVVQGRIRELENIDPWYPKKTDDPARLESARILREGMDKLNAQAEAAAATDRHTTALHDIRRDLKKPSPAAVQNHLNN